MREAIFKAPKGFYCGEEEWAVLVEEWKKTGKYVRPARVKEMFPEQFGLDYVEVVNGTDT